MAYDLSHIRNRVMNDKLDDPNYDPDIIDNFINDTQREIFQAYEFPFAERTFSGTLSQGDTIFLFPTDYDVAQSLILTDPEDVRSNITDNYVGFRDFNTMYPKPTTQDPGTPRLWTLHGNRLYVDRPTDQIYTLDLWYLKLPNTLSDDADVPDLPEPYEELLVMGAYYRCLERNEDFDLAAVIEAKFNTKLDTIVGRATKRQAGKSILISQPNRITSRRRTRR